MGVGSRRASGVDGALWTGLTLFRVSSFEFRVRVKRETQNPKRTTFIMSDLDRLWAPWRSRFVSRRKSGRCIFCVARASRQDREHHVIARGARVFALLNRYPYNNGHVMIATHRHVGTLDAIQPSEWAEMLLMSQRLTARLRRVLRPHAWNIGLNLGRVAGAGIPGHFHLHLVPRWNGDTNFMPVLGGTRVVSQALDELYELLASPRRRSR